MNTRKVNVCGVPFEMSIVDGGVLFSNKSGIYGHSARFMWEYCSFLWYLRHSEETFGRVAGAHLVRMHELLEQHIGREHEQFELKFKPENDVMPPESVQQAGQLTSLVKYLRSFIAGCANSDAINTQDEFEIALARIDYTAPWAKQS